MPILTLFISECRKDVILDWMNFTIFNIQDLTQSINDFLMKLVIKKDQRTKDHEVRKHPNGKKNRC